jgi:hypothetical protein
MHINYLLTFHAIERLQERFALFCARYPELKNWKRGDDISGVRLIIDDLIAKAEENKSFINNTRYMVYVYERYGCDSTYRFFEVKDENMVLLFALTPRKEHRLVTIYPGEFCHMVKTTKFSGTDCKRVKEEKAFQEFIDSLNPIARNCIETKAQDQLHKQLLETVYDGRAKLIERIGASRLYAFKEENQETVFLVSKPPTDCGDPILTIRSTGHLGDSDTSYCEIEEAKGNQPEIIPDPELQRLVDRQLTWDLVSSIHLGETVIIDQHECQKPIHRTILRGVEYDFVYRKNHKKSKIVLLKATTITKD